MNVKPLLLGMMAVMALTLTLTVADAHAVVNMGVTRAGAGVLLDHAAARTAENFGRQENEGKGNRKGDRDGRGEKDGKGEKDDKDHHGDDDHHGDKSPSKPR